MEKMMMGRKVAKRLRRKNQEKSQKVTDYRNDDGAAVTPGECNEKLFRSFVLVDFHKSSLIDS